MAEAGVVGGVALPSSSCISRKTLSRRPRGVLRMSKSSSSDSSEATVSAAGMVAGPAGGTVDMVGLGARSALGAEVVAAIVLIEAVTPAPSTESSGADLETDKSACCLQGCGHESAEEAVALGVGQTF